MSRILIYRPEDSRIEIIPLKENQFGYLCDMNSLNRACRDGHLPIVRYFMDNNLDYDWYTAANTALFHDQLAVFKFILFEEKFKLTDRKGQILNNVSSLEAAEYVYELLSSEEYQDEEHKDKKLTKYVQNMCQGALSKSRLDVLEYFWEKGYRQYNHPYAYCIIHRNHFRETISIEQVQKIMQWLREKKIPLVHSEVAQLDHYRESFPEYEDIIQEILDSMSQDEFERQILQECQKMYGIQLL